MAQRSPVPPFGVWEGGDNVPYTDYFEKARKGRTGGKTRNPSEPQENPDLVADHAAPASATPSQARSESEESAGRGAFRPAHERGRNREDKDLKQFANSPARHDKLNRRVGNELAPHQRPGGRGVSSGETSRRPGRPNAASDNSVERSPLHHQAKNSGRGSGDPLPAWEGKSSYVSGHGTPGRTRPRPRGDESPDKVATVPKFGDWDEGNPSSSDGFTDVFNRVREERQTGATRVPSRPTESSHGIGRLNNSDSKCRCFPWGR